MYPTHAGPIACTMLVLLPHKYKVGHIDLLTYYQNLKFLDFHMCHMMPSNTPNSITGLTDLLLSGESSTSKT